MRNPVLICACVVAVGLSAAQAIAAQKSIVASKDNTLYEDPDGVLSNGVGEHFFVGLSSPFTVTVRRGVLQWDVASMLPSGAIIQSAEIRLNMSATISGDFQFDFHRLSTAWGEGDSDAPGEEGAGFAAAPGDATWLHTFYENSFWTNPGGDFVSTISASQTVGSELGFYTWTSSQLVADVQDMLDNPGANFGWILMGGEDTPQSAKRFDTRENATEEFRPLLILTYQVPAPGAVALLGLGALAPRRRRR